MGKTMGRAENIEKYLCIFSVYDTGLAEGVGFEPTTPFGEHALQACALSRSAIPPNLPISAPVGR
jgi:hypothetical protein